MAVAHIFAQELGPVQGLPPSLADVEVRARFVDEMDGPFIPATDKLPEFFVYLGRRLATIAKIGERYMPDVPDSLMRVNTALRLWAGCISAAKTIAYETRSGPNTPESRREGMAQIEHVAQGDPIYAAGVEAAPTFKKLRNEGYSFDGVTEGALVRRHP